MCVARKTQNYYYNELISPAQMNVRDLLTTTSIYESWKKENLFQYDGFR